MIVVADTSPLNYLAQLQLSYVLPRLYGDVILPPEVVAELTASGAPPSVRQWAHNLPPWIKVHAAQGTRLPELDGLGPGERAAITLANEIQADRLLLDERKARHVVATYFSFVVSGTLSVLRDAHLQGFLDGRNAFSRLRTETNFYCTQS